MRELIQLNHNIAGSVQYFSGGVMGFKKYVFLIILFFSMVVYSQVSAEQGLMQIDKTQGLQSKEDLQKMYVDYLNAEGFKPEIDSSGDIFFKYETTPFYIAVEEKDPQFFRIFIPQIWEFADKDLNKALAACEYTTGHIKVAKVSIVRNYVWVSAESLVPAPDQFKLIFKRTLSVCKTARVVFMEKMRE